MTAEEVITSLKAEMAETLIGQEEVVDAMLIGLLTGGHILLEGVPGLAKTLAVRTLAHAVGGDFSRIQFTPDLLPSDIVGATVYLPEEHRFETRLGPIAANLVLADEVNRAPAKVQSALLEAMQEHQVTIGGRTFSLPQPFMVVATENPIEHTGTYPLPEAQKDRFMLQVRLAYPQRDEERSLMERFGGVAEPPMRPPVVTLQQVVEARTQLDEVHIEDSLKEYALDIVIATRPAELGKLSKAQQDKGVQKALAELSAFIETGASPRATLAILKAAKAMALLNLRRFVLPEDVKASARLALPHRIQLTFEGEARKLTADGLIENMLRQIVTP